MESTNHKKTNRFLATVKYLSIVLKRLSNLGYDTDREGTINGIKGGIVMEGSNLWILICSSIIACIGLDLNSEAVIIGAMLISPLMSPILGIGLAAGTNDHQMMVIASRNFLTAIALGLLVSIMYFLISPLGQVTSELSARTSPTILDAIIALFGGLAGIIAGSRTSKTNAIPGVAIATALMPPLCTAGFGIATGNLEFFGGAIYLFFINSVLITLSTYLVVRILKFPLVEHVDVTVVRKNSRYIAAFIILMLAPSFIFLLHALAKNQQNIIINSFIGEFIHEDVDKGVEWTIHDKDSSKTLRVYYFGETIGNDSITNLERSLIRRLETYRFSPVKLKLELIPTDAFPPREEQQLKHEIGELRAKVNFLEYMYELDQASRNNELMLSSIQSDSAVVDLLMSPEHFEIVVTEVLSIYPELESFTVGKNYFYHESGSKGIIPVATVKWKGNLSASVHEERNNRLTSYLRTRLKADSVRIITFF